MSITASAPSGKHNAPDKGMAATPIGGLVLSFDDEGALGCGRVTPDMEDGIQGRGSNRSSRSLNECKST